MTDPRALAGRRRALTYLLTLDDGDDPGAAAQLTALDDPAELVFLGAELTSLARQAARSLSPQEKAQGTGRQMRLAALRDAGRGSAAGLRLWIAASATETIGLLRRSTPDDDERRALLTSDA